MNLINLNENPEALLEAHQRQGFVLDGINLRFYRIEHRGMKAVLLATKKEVPLGKCIEYIYLRNRNRKARFASVEDLITLIQSKQYTID